MVPRVSRFRTQALLAAMVVGLAAGPAFAADATIKQIYAQAKSGDIDGALAAMGPVLKDHPNSAKAHYVEAELLARDNRIADARAELAKAKSLEPGLPGVSSHSVQELEAKLNGGGTSTGVSYAGPSTVTRQSVEEQRSGGVPWGLIIIAGLVIFGVLAFMRRRSQPVYETPYGGPAPMPPTSGYRPGAGYGQAPGPGYGPGYSGGVAPGGGGIMGGGGLMGGLARGAAMGAGFAAGEEVIDHMFGGERRESGERIVGGDSGGERRVDPNADMGGDDFGVSDSGSWDDSSSGGGSDDGGW
jgi:hypothetical protein